MEVSFVLRKGGGIKCGGNRLQPSQGPSLEPDLHSSTDMLDTISNIPICLGIPCNDSQRFACSGIERAMQLMINKLN